MMISKIQQAVCQLLVKITIAMKCLVASMLGGYITRGTALFWLFGFISANAANWYVDNAATGTKNGTSWANAWTSFSSVVWGTSGVKAGDTLFISGGTTSKVYPASVNRLLTIDSSGTSENNRVTIRVGQDSGHNGIVIFEGNWQYRELIYGANISYVTIDGSYNGAIHWKLRHISTNDLSPGDAYGGILLGGAQTRLKSIEIDGCNSAVAFYGTGGEISDCYFHDVRETVCVSFNTCNSGRTNYDLTYFRGNRMELNNRRISGDGPDGIHGCPGLTIASNYFVSVSGPLGEEAQHQDLIQGQAHYIKIYGNTFENISDSGIDFDGNYSAGNIRIWNNVFKMNYTGAFPSGIRIYSTDGPITNLSDVWICNNTFLDWGIGVGGYVINFQWGNGTAPIVRDVHIKNNIFYNCGLGNNWPVINIGAANSLNFSDWDCNYNLLYSGAHGNSVINFGGTRMTQQNGFTAAPTFQFYSEGSVQNDPHLLQSDTAALSKGANISSMFTTDKDGLPRPSGTTSWDLGAFQRSSVGTNTNQVANIAPVVSAIVSSAIDIDADTAGLQLYGGTPTTYSASASDPNGDTLSWRWIYTVNSGAEQVYSTGTGAVTPITFNYPVGSAGSQYIWILRVSDQQTTVESRTTTTIIAAPAANPYGAVASMAGSSATLTPPMISTDGYIYQPNQTELANSGRAIFNFSVTNNGDYLVMCIVDAPSDSANSLFVNIDSEPQDPSMVWHISPTTGFNQRYASWQGAGTWDKPQYRGVRFTLNAGSHQLIFRGREGNVKISQVYIIPNSSASLQRPTPPSAVSATPTSTNG
jgi:hypothetical protein